jgi:DNA primase large subunit
MHWSRCILILPYASYRRDFCGEDGHTCASPTRLYVRRSSIPLLSPALVLRLVSKKLEGFDGSLDSFLEEQSLNVISSIPSAFRESASDDAASHYILRLGMSKSPEFTEWFIKSEEALLLCKLRQGGGDSLNRIMNDSPDLRHLGRDIVSRQTDSAEFENIRRSTPAPGDQSSAFYRIDFREVPPMLIARRSVVLIAGKAFVPDREMIALIGKKYKDFLTQAMMTATRMRKHLIDTDDRIKAIADRISPAALLMGSRTNNHTPTQKLSLSNFSILLGRSLPPCMRVAVESMRPSEGRNNGRYLKNTGRNQLAPFLRAAGMSMDESLQWWKNEFTRGGQMDSDKFDKNYNYNIKWVYGKAGRMKAAGPMTCSTVIGLEYPGHDQTHGCPFKVLDEAKITGLLRGWLTKANVPIDGNEGRLKEIVRKATGQTREYQLACVDWFTLMHDGHSGEGVGNHPNSYFTESVAYWSEKEGVKADADMPPSQTRAG